MRRSGLGDSPGNGDDSGSPPAAQNVAANIQVTNIARLADHSAAWHLACTVLPALLLGRRQGGRHHVRAQGWLRDEQGGQTMSEIAFVLTWGAGLVLASGLGYHAGRHAAHAVRKRFSLR